MKEQLRQAQAAGQVVLVRATSKQGNPVERYGHVDQLGDAAVTIALLDRERPEYRAVPYAQIVTLLVGDDARAAVQVGA